MSADVHVADAATEDIWNNIKTGRLKTGGVWNEHVEKAIAAKRRAFKAWKTGKGTRASYDAAKRISKCIARHPVHHARQEADLGLGENWPQVFRSLPPC